MPQALVWIAAVHDSMQSRLMVAAVTIVFRSNPRGGFP